VEFKFTKPNAKENFKKITPRKILALWLVVSLVLTILAPKLFNLKDYKTDQILFTILIANFILMLLIVYLVKTIKGSGDK
jgi:hypothetical protein